MNTTLVTRPGAPVLVTRADPPALVTGPDPPVLVTGPDPPVLVTGPDPPALVARPDSPVPGTGSGPPPGTSPRCSERAASTTCSTISAVDRLRVSPACPVAQNGQA